MWSGRGTLRSTVSELIEVKQEKEWRSEGGKILLTQGPQGCHKNWDVILTEGLEMKTDLSSLSEVQSVLWVALKGDSAKAEAETR